MEVEGGRFDKRTDAAENLCAGGGHAFIGSLEPEEHADGGGLAGAVGAKEGVDAWAGTAQVRPRTAGLAP
jgi:hypothetical protein